MYDAFFTDPKRQRKPEETYDLKGSVLKIIKEIQSKEKGIIFKGEPENVENINLYVFLNTENLPVNLESADDAFSRYLKECYTKSSEEYFVKIVQFVSLFRDFLNCKNQGENKEDIYSIKKGAMKLPDSCNEFVSDFVEKNMLVEESNDALINGVKLKIGRQVEEDEEFKTDKKFKQIFIPNPYTPLYP